MKAKESALAFITFLFLSSIPSAGICQGWDDVRIRLLPDSSFALVEKGEGAKMIRHCPHHAADGTLDEEQVIYSLGAIEEETWIDRVNLQEARKHLETHYQSLHRKMTEKDLQDPIHINGATLAELVSLPQVGPVLAVKIVRYRKAHGPFIQPEDVRKVEGIGTGIYQSIRHYIKTD